MKSLPTALSAASWEAQNNLVIEQNFRQLEESLRAGYQPLDAELTALAGLTSAADKVPYFTGSGTAALADFTAAGRALVDDANEAAQRTTLGLVIGTHVQAWDATLDALAAANWAANSVPIGSGADTLAQVAFAANTFPARASTGNLVAKTITDFGLSLVAEANAGDARTRLALGSIATQSAAGVAITGGTIDATTIGGTVRGAVSCTTLNANGACTLGDAAADTITITGTPAGQVVGGTYTPTLTNTANIAASTAFVCQYMRVGSVVTVSGLVNIDPTSGATLTTLGLTIPVASDFTAIEQLAGTAVCEGLAGVCAVIFADTTNNRAQMQFVTSADVTNRSWLFQFTYLIV